MNKGIKMDELQPNPGQEIYMGNLQHSMSDICAPDQAAHDPTNPFLLYPLPGLLQQHWTRLRPTLLRQLRLVQAAPCSTLPYFPLYDAYPLGSSYGSP